MIGGGGSAVIGRACSSHIRPSAYARFDVLWAPEVLGDFDAQPGQICQHGVRQSLNVGRLARLMGDSATRDAADDALLGGPAGSPESGRDCRAHSDQV